MYKPSTYLQLPIFLPICLHMRATSYSSGYQGETFSYTFKIFPNVFGGVLTKHKILWDISKNEMRASVDVPFFEMPRTV
jgi:hypothetical protein